MAGVSRLISRETAEQYQQRIAEHRQENRQREVRWRATLPQVPPPDGCPGIHCDGQVEWEGQYWPCPWEGPECPHASRRELTHRHRILQHLGFGARYWNPELERVPETIRENISHYLSTISQQVHSGQGLWLEGGPGTGKSSICALIAYRAALAGHTVGYWYCPELFDALHRDDWEQIHRARECDLLMMDDWGVQYSADWVISRFDSLIEYRYSRREGKARAMIVTSNAKLSDVARDPTWRRVLDRWAEVCEPLGTGSRSQRRRRQ